MSEREYAALGPYEVEDPMNTRGSLVAASLALAWMGGCAAPPDSEDATEGTTVEDLPLDITVDSLDVVHGALRIIATMVDGAADVSVMLGGECEHAEVGGGISTLSTLVWALGESDVANAIRCGLVVRARVHEGGHEVTKSAELNVGFDLVLSASELTEDPPQPMSLVGSPTGITIRFSQVTRSARLTTGDSILSPERPDTDEDLEASPNAAEFVVPRADFARSVVRKRRFSLEGVPFQPLVSVGSVLLQDDCSDSLGPDEPEEEAPPEPGPEGTSGGTFGFSVD
jgi:hypothetical protein